MELTRLANETPFEYKLRLCLAKLNHEIDLDWAEIVDMLGLDVSADHLRKTAYGLQEYDEYIHSFNGVATTILSISDLHVPFQLDYTKLKNYRNVDILQINGDVVDCQSLSKFTKTFRISPMEEIIQARQYLIDLIEYVNPKKVICNFGNHDIRFQNYLAKNLDSDLFELMPKTSLELMFVDGFHHYDKRNGCKIYYAPLTEVFSDKEVEYVDDWKSRIGEAIFVHPLAYRSGFLATADKAKDYLQDTEEEPFSLVCMAHTHSIGDAMKGRIRLLEQGAFARVEDMQYADGRLTKPQKKGFAFICEDENGRVINDKTKVVTID